MLVLGGGSARGISSIGVLKVLERHFGRDRMPFDMVIGTSIGGLIGAAYCLGLTPEEMEKVAEEFKWPKFLDLGLNSTGLVKGDKLEEMIIEFTGNMAFSDMKIPFALTTTDIETGEELVHTSGDLVKLVRASCSWPGIFSAVDFDGRKLVDGGLRNSIPTKDAHDLGATFILAVNPGFGVKNHKVGNVIQALIQSFQIMGDELNAYQARSADVVIKPDLGDLDQFDFEKSKFIIEQGEEATRKKMEELKRKLWLHWLV